MKAQVLNSLKFLKLDPKELENLIEIPKNPDLGDYSLPCFTLAKKLKKNPGEIAKEIASKVSSKEFEKVQALGPYVNFFLNRKEIAAETLKKILKEKDKFGSNTLGKGKTLVIEMSSPNIAKPFGIGHLRSTIIGSSLANISKLLGYKVIKINYLGDWGTQFGRLLFAYNKWGNESKLKKDATSHLLELYVKANKEEYEQEARDWFRKLEEGDKQALSLWKKFREHSVKEFQKIYYTLGVKFDVISGESLYQEKMKSSLEELEKSKLLEESEGATIVNLEKYDLGVCLIKKSDGATLYATRDIAAAIDRQKKFKFTKMIYEVGSEQTLHFKQIFKILELLGHKWAKDCIHVGHGLYLGEDKKRFRTREGKTVFMEDIIQEAKTSAKEEVKKRFKLGEKALDERAEKIALAAIFYGDLKNYRMNDIVFDIKRFVSFEGDTGPYLLYSYARAKSILRKAKLRTLKIGKITDIEKKLILELNNFPQVVKHAHESLSPNIIANYSFQLSQLFNEFYHSSPVIDSEEESFRIAIVEAFAQVLKNSLALLGINVLEEM